MELTCRRNAWRQLCYYCQPVINPIKTRVAKAAHKASKRNRVATAMRGAGTGTGTGTRTGTGTGTGTRTGIRTGPARLIFVEAVEN